MSLKAMQMRVDAELSPSQNPMIPFASYNGWTVSRIVRTQDKSSRQELQDYSAEERARIEARFWSKVKKSDGCWLWVASVTDGKVPAYHAQFKFPSIRGVQPHIYAHRFSWILAYGPIPDGLQVCHRCDVPRCVRPEHLFLGTQEDNLTDARRKGRLNASLPRTNLLTPSERLAIYSMPNRRGICAELAIRYGVTESHIGNLRRGRFAGAPLQRIAPRAYHRKSIRQCQQQLRGAGVRHA